MDWNEYKHHYDITTFKYLGPFKMHIDTHTARMYPVEMNCGSNLSFSIRPQALWQRSQFNLLCKVPLLKDNSYTNSLVDY